MTVLSGLKVFRYSISVTIPIMISISFLVDFPKSNDVRFTPIVGLGLAFAIQDILFSEIDIGMASADRKISARYIKEIGT